MPFGCPNIRNNWRTSYLYQSCGNCGHEWEYHQKVEKCPFCRSFLHREWYWKKLVWKCWACEGTTPFLPLTLWCNRCSYPYGEECEIFECRINEFEE